MVAGVRNIFYLKYYLGFFILKRIYEGYAINFIFLKCGCVSSLYTINKVCGFFHSVKICCDAICFTRGHAIPQVYLNSPSLPVWVDKGTHHLKNIPVNIKEFKPDLILSVPALAKNFKKNIEQGIRARGKNAVRLFNLALRIGYI